MPAVVWRKSRHFLPLKKGISSKMQERRLLNVGVDVGSTTVKIVITEGDKLLYQKYERHYSQVRHKTLAFIRECEEILRGCDLRVAISGSAGLGLADAAGLLFVQEVYATFALVKEKEPGTDVVIELGGEDAKIIFLKGGVDERMNGTCAGGTGACGAGRCAGRCGKRKAAL